MHLIKSDLTNALETAFPQFKAFLDRSDDNNLVLDLPNPSSAFGGLVVQIDNNDIWFRSYQSYTACSIDTFEELVFFISKVLNDEIIVAVSMNNGDWIETAWNFANEGFVLPDGLENKVYSWSGKLDYSSK